MRQKDHTRSTVFKFDCEVKKDESELGEEVIAGGVHYGHYQRYEDWEG